MAFSHILLFWVLATTLHGACEADKFTKEWELKYTESLNGVLFADDRFLAYGGRKKVLNTDGETWREVDDRGGEIDPIYLQGATYAGSNKFVVVGYDNGNKVHLSVDGGESWGTGTVYFLSYAIAFGGGNFITGGSSSSRKASSSSDVQNYNSWTTVSGPAGDWNITDIIYTDKFVGCGNGIYTSNGDSWERQYSLLSPKFLHGIAYGNGIYVAVGDDGTILRSTDTSTWTDVSLTVETPKKLWGVAFGANKFIVVDIDGKMYGSEDGSAWTAQINSPPPIVLGNFSNHLAFGKGQFVVVSSSGIYVADDNVCSSNEGGSVVLHSHWAWCLMICLSIILLH